MTNKPRAYCVFFLVCLFCGAVAGAAQDYYVSSEGNDTHQGSIEQPFKTIQRAADVAQPGDVVHIRAGIYRETVRPARSGKQGTPVRFTAYRREEVIISGCDPVTDWTCHLGDIWKASVSWNAGTAGTGNTLFVNGVLKFEARQGAENDPLELDNWGHIPSGRLKSTHFTARDLTGWGDDFWNGAKVRHHTKDWVIMNSTIADYDSASGKVTFAKSVGTISQKHVLGYYIYDTIKALDHAGEWFKDRSTGILYYQVDSGQNPNTKAIEFKRRAYGFDLRDRDFVTVQGIEFRGVSIRTDADTDHNIYRGNRFYAYDKANYGSLRISGDHNLFRDNEVSHTWGSFASIGGTRNRIVNNYIHDIGYYGTSRAISMSGSEHLFSHNTVSKIARSFLDGYPYRSEFAYNIFEDGANLSWDTGFFDGDSGRGNGGGCIIHHNVLRNSESIGIFCSFYAGLDLVVHHNIVHDLTGPTSPTLRVGQLIFGKYYHNTLIGSHPTGKTNAGGFAVESNYNNNLQVTTDFCTSIGVNCRGNHNYTDSDFVNAQARDFRLAADSQAIDAGIVLPHINDGYTGAAPDAGALEYGQPMWAVGHDFVNPPDPEYAWELLPGTNIFGNGQFRDTPSGWICTGSPVWFNGNAWNTFGRGLSRIGGRAFQLNPGDGLHRVFTSLKPNTWYTVGTETRLVDQRIEMEDYQGKRGTVTSGNHRSENYVQGLTEGEWLRYDHVDFGAAGKYNLLELTFSRPPRTPPYSDPAWLEVRRASATGPVLGVFDYNPVVQDSWFTARIHIPALSGQQSLYLLAKGPGASLMRLASLRLINTNIAPQRRLTLGIRNYGGWDLITGIGEAFWRHHYETVSFKTGPDSTSAELVLQNNGTYDAYLDRLALYEKEDLTENVALTGVATLSSGNGAGLAIDGNPDTVAITGNQPRSWWEIDLGRQQPIYRIKLTAPQAHPGQLSNFRVSLWSDSPYKGGTVLWQQDYMTAGTLVPGETLVIKASDKASDGVTELQDIDARFVKIQLLGQNNLGNGILGMAEVEVIAFDEMDLVVSDGSVHQDNTLWQASFAQVINIGQMVLDGGSEGLGSFNVTVWDRAPKEGGQILWQKAYFQTSGSRSLSENPIWLRAACFASGLRPAVSTICTDIACFAVLASPKTARSRANDGIPRHTPSQGDRWAISGDEISDNGVTRLASVSGRAVRIQSNGGNLSRIKTRIHSSADVPPPHNIAMAGQATQSKNYYTDKGFAGDAINGIILPEGDFTTAAREPGAWWQVDLQQTATINQIVLFNRTNAASRIGRFRVSVWDKDPGNGGNELWGKNYSYANGDLPAGGSLTINGSVTAGRKRLDEIDNGRVVRVQLHGTELLSLVEVQVWSKE